MSRNNARNRLLNGMFNHGITRPINNIVEILGGGRAGDAGGLNPNREEERLVMEMRARMEADNARTLAKRSHRFYD